MRWRRLTVPTLSALWAIKTLSYGGDHDDESWSRASPLVVRKGKTKHPECTV